MKRNVDLRLISMAVGLLTVMSVVPLAAKGDQDGQAKAPLVTYDHAGVNADREYKRNVADGVGFIVKIENTCPEYFEYPVTAIPAEPPPPAADRTLVCEPGQSVSIPIDHDEANGGYILEIRRKGRSRVVKIRNGKVLNDVKLVISVTTRSWKHDFLSGFTVSNLTNPRFGLQTKMVDGEEQSFVVEDRGAEDEASLGAAAFVNVFRSEFPDLGLSFGLGISEETEATYYAGLSWRWGDRGALTFGRAFGSVDQLPPGTDISQPVDANFLSSLDSRVDSDYFVSFTYSFLGGADRFKKPFEKLEPKQTSNSTHALPRSSSGSPADVPAQTDRQLTGEVATPSNVTVMVQEDGLKVSWDADSENANYHVYRSSVSCEKEMDRVAQLEGDTEFLDTDVLPGQQYHYRVSAVTNQGESLPSDCRSVEVPDAS